MDHHAQASLFIILSVLIVTIAGVFFVQQSQLRNAVPPAMSEVGVVREFIAACLSQSAREAASWFYMRDPDVDIFPLIESGGKIVWWPVWYDRGRIMLSDDVNSLIENYARESQKECTSGFQELPLPMYENGMSVEVKLSEDGVWFTLHQPVVVEEERAQTVLADPYIHKVQVRLKTMLEVARGIIERVLEEPGEIPIEFMVDQSILNDLKVTYAYLDRDGKRDTDLFVYRIEDRRADQNIRNPYISFIARME